MYTDAELARTATYMLVDRTGGAIDAGWRVKGSDPDDTIFELHKDGVDKEGKPVTMIKVRTIDELRQVQQDYDENARQTWERQEAERAEHARAVAVGSKTTELVELERDDDGLIVVPEWFKASSARDKSAD